MSLRRRLFPFLYQRPERSIVQVVYVGYPAYALQSPLKTTQEDSLTVGLSPREVVFDDLLCRIQDDSTIKRRRVLQAYSWEVLRPVEHIGRRELGYDRCQYFRMSPVVNAGGFFEQETDRVDPIQRRVLYFSD